MGWPCHSALRKLSRHTRIRYLPVLSLQAYRQAERSLRRQMGSRPGRCGQKPQASLAPPTPPAEQMRPGLVPEDAATGGWPGLTSSLRHHRSTFVSQARPPCGDVLPDPSARPRLQRFSPDIFCHFGEGGGGGGWKPDWGGLLLGSEFSRALQFSCAGKTQGVLDRARNLSWTLLELELDSRCREKEGREGRLGEGREKGGWQKGSKDVREDLRPLFAPPIDDLKLSV